MAERRAAIAVVGMAVTFPGAPDLETFRDNLERGVDAIGAVPPARWDPVYYDPDAPGVDRFYCRRGGFVDDVAGLDPVALGVVPATVDSAEPDQLLTLALASAAIADAGDDVLGERRERTGVIVGRGGYLTPGLSRLDQRVRTSEQLIATLAAVLPDLAPAELAAVKAAFVGALGSDRPDAAIDLVPNLAASRVANRLDLGGPSYTVDAACASSLVAVDQGVAELASGRCDLVLVGGVHLCHDVTIWSVFTQLGALSPSGEIRPFHRGADGLLIGEGGGMIVLERLADAERRGARVHAVIRGVGVASDGRHGSLMRPSVDGQLLALRRAWAGTGLDPASVGLVEAHGTATPTGDGAELETLARFFGSPAGAGGRAALGSVKSMIGHTMPAAGIAGLVKAVHAVETGVLLPTLHCEEPHPRLEGSTLVPLGEADEWPAGDGPRRAVVNAFGFGGINAHVVLDSHDAAGSRRRRRASHEPPAAVPEPLLLLAAPSTEALAAALDRLPATAPGVPVPVGEGPARLALPDPTPERVDLARKIVARGQPWHGRNDCWFSPAGLLSGATGRTGKLAFLFPGVEPTFEPRVDDVAAHLGQAVPELAGPNAAAEDLEGLGRSLVAVGRLLHAAVTDLGVEADLVAGQSIGEWSGMIATAMIPPDEIDGFIDTLRPGSLEVPGVAFAALGCAVEAALSLADGLPGIAVSHDNCPRQTILCGADADVATLCERAKAGKVLAQVLPFRSGFHTRMFEPFLEPFRLALARLPLQRPTVPLWSATTCAPYPDDADGVRALALSHLVERVRFRELTLALHDAGVRAFVQVGAGSLPGLVEDTLRGRTYMTIAANTPRRSGMAQLLRLAGALWVEGLDGLRLERLVSAGAGGNGRAGARPAAGRAPGLRPLPLATPLVRIPPGSVVLRPRSAATRPDPPVVAPEWSEVAGELAALLDEVHAAGAAVAEALAQPAPQPAPAATPASEPGGEHPRVTGAAGDAQLRQQTTRVALSVEEEPAFADHCFYRQPPGWPTMSDRFPVVPMTGLVQMMTDAATQLLPGLKPIGLEDVRALRWLAVAPPVEVVVRAEELAKDASAGERRVRVVIEGYARATVVLADQSPEAPAPALADLSGEDELAVTAESLYQDRWLFHGPEYQGVRILGPMTAEGMDGDLEAGSAPGALLDNAGQLMGFWIMYRHELDRLGLPTSIDRIRFHGAPPAAGERLPARVRIRSVEPTAVRADLELTRFGKVWAQIEGWEDRRFDSDEVVWPVLIWPERSLLTEHHGDREGGDREGGDREGGDQEGGDQEGGDAEDGGGGFELAVERWRSTASRELMMRRYLGEAEREDYARHHPRGQRLFLLGRIAAKDAVRRWLWAHGGGDCWPVQIEIANETTGRPLVRIPGGAQLSVSIAHTPWVGVAVVAEGEAVGIDVEQVEERSDRFSAAAFSAGELELLRERSQGVEQSEWLASAWAAKEAVAKAGGTGLGGRPKDFVVRRMEQDIAIVNERRVRIRRLGEHVVAWTLPDRT
jgi:phosphopantetheine--protein transferase-like protein